MIDYIPLKKDEVSTICQYYKKHTASMSFDDMVSLSYWWVQGKQDFSKEGITPPQFCAYYHALLLIRDTPPKQASEVYEGVFALHNSKKNLRDRFKLPSGGILDRLQQCEQPRLHAAGMR